MLCICKVKVLNLHMLHAKIVHRKRERKKLFQYHSFGINNTQSTKITILVPCRYFIPSTFTLLSHGHTTSDSNYDSIHEIGSKMSPMRNFAISPDNNK